MRRSVLGAVLILLFLSATWLVPVAQAVPGDLDPSFGDGGVVMTDFGGGFENARAMGVLSDGGIVVAGVTSSRIALARFDALGVLDAGFGEAGTVTTTISPFTHVADLAVQADDRIVVAGSQLRTFIAVRYLGDGSLDPSFGDGGIARARVGRWGEANAALVLPDGGIVVAGSSENRFALVRFLPDGALDGSFGSDGIVILPSERRAALRGLALQGERLVAVGSTRIGDNREIVVARFEADGSLDPTFGSAGMVTTKVCYRGGRAGALVVDGIDRLVVTGSCGWGSQVFVARYGPDGVLDPALRGDGIVVTDIRRSGDEAANAVTVDGDGRIVVGGKVGSTPRWRWAVLRYLDDGRRDRSFGEDGIDALEIAGFSGVRDVVVRPDGSILAAGTAPGARSDTDLGVAQLDETGALDPAFGLSGLGTADFNAGPDVAGGIVVQPDGRIVAAGATSGDFGVARYLASGALDPTFGVGGKVTTAFINGGVASALTVLSDGRVVVAGNHRGFLVARYLPDGSLDGSFSTDGMVETHRSGLRWASAIVADPGGAVVVGGTSTEGFALARYMPGGALDPAFGQEGVVTTPVGDELTSLVRQPDGRIVAAGWSEEGFVLARYEVDGSLDPTFGGDGIVRTTFSSGRHGASAVTIQADGRLVATGRTGTAECAFALARYEPDGSLDPTFGSGGMVTTDLGPACERASEVRVQPDGRIVAAGGGGDAIQTAIAVARYLPNGSLDPSFGDGGIVLEDVSPAEDWAFGLAIQQDGGILAAGTGSFPSDWILLRLLG